MKGNLGDETRLQHIFECIDEIETAIAGLNLDTFIENHVTRIAVVKWLEIIGEASKHISDDMQRKHHTIEWKSVIDLRNFVVHEYFEINYEAIWHTVKILLPDLKLKLKAIKPE